MKFIICFCKGPERFAVVAEWVNAADSATVAGSNPAYGRFTVILFLVDCGNGSTYPQVVCVCVCVRRTGVGVLPLYV